MVEGAEAKKEKGKSKARLLTLLIIGLLVFGFFAQFAEFPATVKADGIIRSTTAVSDSLR